MKTREEVIEMIHQGELEKIKSNSQGDRAGFGMIEMRALLDFIYCGEPKNDNELLLTLDKLE